MNILLDECVDRRLARDLLGLPVATVPRKGWSGIKNGDLLALAEREFESTMVSPSRRLSRSGAEPARGDGHVVVEQAVQGSGGIGVNFAHVGRNLITDRVLGHG